MYGNNIRSARELRGLSVSELANKSRVSYMTVKRVERGDVIPSLDTAIKLARGVDFSLDRLFMPR